MPIARATRTDRPASPGAAWSPSTVRPRSVVVVGRRAGDSLRNLVETIPGLRARFLQEVPPAGHQAGSELAIGVFAADAHEPAHAFSTWAWAAKVPAIEIVLGPRNVLLGPLAIPGRVGCGACAHQRLAAASPAPSPIDLRSDGGPGGIASSQDLGAAGPVLAEELAALTAIVGRLPYLSRLVDHVLAVDRLTGDSSLHRVIPASRCAVCGGVADTVARPWPKRLSADDAPETILHALSGWVDPLTGIVPSLVMEPDDVPDLPVVITATPPHVVEPDGARRQLPGGWGRGMDLSGAIAAAVGEAIERYAASTPDPSRVVWECRQDLHGEVLDPRTFALHAPEQYRQSSFPYAPFDDDAAHPWMIGTWLDSGSPVWVPAVFSLLSLDVRRKQMLCQATPNGLAASTDPQDAALRATLELVERDAFLAAWLTGCAGRRVAIDDAVDPAVGRVLAAVETLAGEVELYLLPTSACGTTALALGLGDGVRWPGAVVGLGADLDPHVAVRRAVLELAQHGSHLARGMGAGLLSVPATPDAVQHKVDHAAWYVPVERRSAFDRLRDSEGAVSLHTLTAEPTDRPLRRCAAELAAAGVRVALVDVTSPDVATGPFTVIRAVSPDLQPISYGVGLERLPVARIAGLVTTDAPPVHPLW